MTKKSLLVIGLSTLLTLLAIGFLAAFLVGSTEESPIITKHTKHTICLNGVTYYLFNKPSRIGKNCLIFI